MGPMPMNMDDDDEDDDLMTFSALAKARSSVHILRTLSSEDIKKENEDEEEEDREDEESTSFSALAKSRCSVAMVRRKNSADDGYGQLSADETDGDEQDESSAALDEWLQSGGRQSLNKSALSQKTHLPALYVEPVTSSPKRKLPPSDWPPTFAMDDSDSDLVHALRDQLKLSDYNSHPLQTSSMNEVLHEEITPQPVLNQSCCDCHGMPTTGLYGQHRLKHKDGFSYNGEWGAGKWNGNGRWSHPSMGTYDGAWNNNLFHGAGTFIFPDGEIFDG
eukprot:494325-Rhodomonas_salina.1